MQKLFKVLEIITFKLSSIFYSRNWHCNMKEEGERRKKETETTDRNYEKRF